MVVRTTAAHPLPPSLSWCEKRDGYGETWGAPAGNHPTVIRVQETAWHRLSYSLRPDFADVDAYDDYAYAVHVAIIPYSGQSTSI
jgi:hypothetical protein